MAIAPAPTVSRSTSLPGAWRMLLLFLAPATFIMGMDRAVLTVTAPALQDHYELTLTQLGLLFSIFHWSYAAMQIPAGLIIHRYGPRTALLGAVLLWSAMTALTPLAGGFLMLVVTRALLGAGQSGDWPAAITGINNLFSDAERPRANSVLLAALYIGPIVGAPIAGYLTVHFGWRPVFFVAAAIGVAFAILGAKVYDDGQSGNSGSARTAPAHRLSARDWLQSAAPLVLVYMAMGMLFSLYLLWLPTYLIKGREMGVGMAGVISGAVSAGLCVGVVIGGQLLPLLRARCSTLRRAHIPLGAGAIATASLCGVLTPLMTSDWLVVAIPVIAAVALGLCQVVFWSSVQDIGGSRTPIITGATLLAGNLTAGASPLLSAVIFDSTKSWMLSLGVVGVTGLVGLVAYLFVDPDKPLAHRGD